MMGGLRQKNFLGYVSARTRVLEIFNEINLIMKYGVL